MHDGVDHELAMAYGDEFDANKILGYPLREFAEQTGLNPKLVSSRIKMLCSKVLEALDAPTIDLTLLNKEEEKFIVKLQQLIATRIDQMMHSADEMMRVSFLVTTLHVVTHIKVQTKKQRLQLNIKPLLLG